MSERRVVDIGWGDLPWWGRRLYRKSSWFQRLCHDAWTFRRFASRGPGDA